MFILLPILKDAIYRFPALYEMGARYGQSSSQITVFIAVLKGKKTKYAPEVNWILPKQLKYRHSITVSSVMNTQR